jgi:hypothetical protein
MTRSRTGRLADGWAEDAARCALATGARWSSRSVKGPRPGRGDERVFEMHVLGDEVQAAALTRPAARRRLRGRHDKQEGVCASAT